MKNWKRWKNDKKGKEALKGYTPETAQKIDFFEKKCCKNSWSNCGWKKTDFQQTRKEEEKKKHEIEVTLKWASPNSLSAEAQKSNFHKRKSSFYNRNFWTIFCGFWRLLGQQFKKKKEKEKKKRKKKGEKNIYI